MSRFFAGGSDSDTSDSESDVEIQNQDQERNRFVNFESSSDEEEKRVVLSAKDKTLIVLMDIVAQVKNHSKINDWVALEKDYEALTEAMKKAVKANRVGGIPRIYFKTILSLEDSVKTTIKDQKTAKNKFNSSNAKAVNKMKQKLSKNRKLYAKQIALYEKNPLTDEEEKLAARTAKPADSDSDSDDSDDDSGDSDDSDSDSDTKTRKSSGDDSDNSSNDGSGDDDDDSDKWDSDGSDDSDSDLEDLNQEGAEKGIQFTRAFWMKTADSGSSSKRKLRKNRGRKKKKKTDDKKEVVKEEKKKEEELTPEKLIKKLNELLAMRGKRGTDKPAMIADLKMLATKATDPAALLKVKTTLASALFDLSLNKGAFMPVATWKDAYQVMLEIVDLMAANPLVRLSENEDVSETFDEGDEQDAVFGAIIVPEKEQTEEEKKAEADKLAEAARKEQEQEEKGEGPKYVIGNMLSFVQKLVDEYTKSLQNIDPHSAEFVSRLQDEKDLIALIHKARKYYQSISKITFETSVCLMWIELEYYHYHIKQDIQRPKALAWKAAQKAADGKDEKVAPVAAAPTTDAKDAAADTTNTPAAPGDVTIVEKLAKFLYSHGDGRGRTRALLCHVFYLALHNNYYAARDLLLMSHVQDNINDADVRTRILFNRAIAQVGLCGFRTGDYHGALLALSDLYQSSRIKELLAQGITTTRYQDRDAQKEKVERRRQFPYHMHMNLDMIEASYLMCAMFLGVPNLVKHGVSESNKRRAISKPFRRLFEHYQRQAFNGPPENTRDLLMHATTNLCKGNSDVTLKSILRLRMWKMIPNTSFVKSLITKKVREQSLEVFLVKYSGQYVSISGDSLCSMFNLSQLTVHKLVSKMVDRHQLSGTWDQPSNSIMMHSQGFSGLEKAALKYSDKTMQFVEQNERLMDLRQPYFNKDSGRKWGDYNRRKGNSNYSGSYNSY